MRIDRMLSIVIILLNCDRVSAKELALKFEVNTRTIYRDIDAINMAGIPVVSYQGNNGGYQSVPETAIIDILPWGGAGKGKKLYQGH